MNPSVLVNYVWFSQRLFYPRMLLLDNLVVRFRGFKHIFWIQIMKTLMFFVSFLLRDTQIWELISDIFAFQQSLNSDMI